MPIITTTAVSMTSGATAAAGTGEDTKFTFGGVWATGDTWTVILTDAVTAAQTQIGAGNVTAVNPTFIFTFQNKVYALSEATVYFSAVAEPTVWNDPNATGNGFVTMSNWYATPEPIISMAVYQGRLAFFSRQTTQIWTVAANPAQWVQNQVLQNIGALAPQSVQSYGELDVYFLSDSGVRSLRVRDASNNAYVDDIGSAVDALVQADIAAIPELLAQYGSVSIVEPLYHRYLLFVPSPIPNHPAPITGKIYVLSYFRSSKIAAWSTYQCTYGTNLPGSIYLNLSAPDSFFAGGAAFATINGPIVPGGPNVQIATVNGQLTAAAMITALVAALTNGYTATIGPSVHEVVISPPAGITTFQANGNISTNGGYSVNSTQIPFRPQGFVILQGEVFFRDTDSLYVYGPSNAPYDDCVAMVLSPYMDAKKPAVRKLMQGLDMACEGDAINGCTWTLQGSIAPKSRVFKTVVNNVKSATIGEVQVAFPWSDQGSHFAFKAFTVGAGSAKFSEIIFHFLEQGEKK